MNQRIYLHSKQCYTVYYLSDQELPPNTLNDLRLNYDKNGAYQGYDNQGCYWHTNGNMYIGDWKNNNQNGNGTLYMANGKIIRGTFQSGKLENIGLGIYHNGDVYAGEWKEGIYNGKGMLYNSLLNKWEIATFENGIRQSIIDQGLGKPIRLSKLIIRKLESALGHLRRQLKYHGI